MARWYLLALKRAPAISEKNGSGTVGRVGAQTSSMSQLPRWKWKSGNSTATDTRNSFPSQAPPHRIARSAMLSDRRAGRQMRDAWHGSNRSLCTSAISVQLEGR
jgi:hypothetical protein